MSALGAPIVGRPIRLALAGCGRIAASHFAAIAQHRDDLELAAVCDVDAEALRAAAEHTRARPFDHLGAMLQSGAADCVVLATPSGLHAAQTIECARAGLHVVTEKPMATRWQDGLAMVRACDDAAVRLFVVKQNRRNATLELLKQAVVHQRFGRIYAVAVNVFWTRPQSYYDSAAWRGTWEFDGGAFMNQASHYVDLLDWIVGPLESVMAYTGTLARNIEVEDTGVAALRWRNGAMGTLNVTMLAYPKNLEGSITVLGEKGTVRIGGVAVNRIEQWQFAEPHAMDSEVPHASYDVASVYGHGHALYYDNVIKTLRGQATADTDGREGLRALELLVAMYLSARDGRRVSLPLQL
jgi:UDP-N-acetyl-2-amino-2-deoxyglucuronate dehydrogenase